METHLNRDAGHLRTGHITRFSMMFITSIAVMGVGCASAPGETGMLGKTLQTIGVKDPPPERERAVPMRLHAGDNLNSGTGPRASAVVVKVYRLRGTQRFEQAPFEAFLDETREKQALGADLVSVEEVVLTPGTRHERVETVSPETTALGVVALFQAPASARWRLTFDPRYANVERDGITLGVHACALSTGSPALLTRLASDASSLASVQCARAR